MDPIAARIAALSKEIERQDALARSLRDEVDTLEQLRAAAEMDENPFDGDSRGAPGSPVRRMPVPDDWLTELFAARDALARAQSDFRAARAEEERCFRLAQRNASATNVLAEQLSALFAAANWKPGAKKGYVCPITLNDDISQMKKQVVDLYRERTLALSSHDAQTKELERLAKEIASLEHVDAEVFHAKEEVKIKRIELQRVRDECTSLARLLTKKQTMVERLAKRDDTLRIRGAEGDKRVAQKKVALHDDALRRGEQSLRVRALQIQRLEEKLELIGEAIRGDDGTDGTVEGDAAAGAASSSSGAAAVERVPADALEELRREVDALQAEALENDRKMQLLDADHEDLEARVRALTRATVNAERERDRVLLTHRKNIAYLDKELRAQAEETDALIRQTQEQVEVLRSQTQSRSASHQPTTTTATAVMAPAATA